MKMPFIKDALFLSVGKRHIVLKIIYRLTLDMRRRKTRERDGIVSIYWVFLGVVQHLQYTNFIFSVFIIKPPTLVVFTK